MATKKKKKWKKFEEVVADIQRELSPEAEVTTNQSLPGKRSNTQRQIDICIKQKVGQYDILIIVDCKDYKHPLDVREVESFLGMVEDVGANKGALISVKGFSKSAKTRAKEAGVNLYTLVDAKNEEWKSFVTIPVLVKDMRLPSYGFTFEAVPFKPFLLAPQDWRSLPLFRSDGQFIDYLRNLVLDRWEDESIPHIPGAHDKIPLTPEETWTKTNGQLYAVKVYVNAIVKEEMRFGNVSLVDFQGLRDDMTGGLLAKSFTTEKVDFETIDKQWQVISSGDELAVKPVLVMGVSSTYPRIPPPDDPSLL
jgi:hypothetical protein